MSDKKTTEKRKKDYFGQAWHVTIICLMIMRHLPAEYKENCKEALPLGQALLIDVTFNRVAVGFIGLSLSTSMSRHSYILTTVDFVTWYPEAIAVHKIGTVTVNEVFLLVWAHVGIPQEILSDNRTQFAGSVDGGSESFIVSPSYHLHPIPPLGCAKDIMEY